MDLIKVSEIVIKFPSFENGTTSFSYSGFFPQSFGVMNNRYILFKKDYDYFYIDIENNSCKKICEFGFKPGKTFFAPTSLTISCDREILTTDSVRRINIYNENGNFKESYVTPATLGSNWMSRKFKDKIYFSEENITSLDLNTGEIKNITNFKFEDIKNTDENTPRLVNSDSLLFDITPEGNLIIVKPLEPYIYEYSPQGDLIHKFEEIPSNFVPFYDIDPYKMGEKMLSINWNEDQREDQYGWFDKWSFSGNPYVFKKDYFVVSRRSYPPILLDFYSLKSKKYLGQINIENKTLLYADDQFIYLRKDSKEKEFIVEKYEVAFNNETKKKSDQNIEHLVLTIEEPESKYDPSKNQYKLIREKDYQKTDEITSISNISLKNIDEIDFSLTKCLNKDKKYHFLINARVFMDCGLPKLMADVDKFCEENSNFDYNLIYTHPYKVELKSSLKFFKFDVDPIFNIDLERILGFYSKSDDSLYPSVTISLVDNEGNFVCNWKDDNFFEEVAQKYGLG